MNVQMTAKIIAKTLQIMKDAGYAASSETEKWLIIQLCKVNVLGRSLSAYRLV